MKIPAPQVRYNKNKIKVKHVQIERFTKSRVAKIFDDESIPMSKLDKGSMQEVIEVSRREDERSKVVSWTKGYIPTVTVVRDDGAQIQVSMRYEKETVVLAWNEAFDGKIYLR